MPLMLNLHNDIIVIICILAATLSLTSCQSQSTTPNMKNSDPVSLIFPNATDPVTIEVRDGSTASLSWKAKAQSSCILKVSISSDKQAALEGATTHNLSSSWNSFNVTIRGKLIGKTFVTFSVLINGSNVAVPESARVNVKRSEHFERLDNIFTIVISVCILFYNFGVGCSTDVRIIWKVLKRPIGPAIGFCCQFIVMPLLAFGVISALDIRGAEAFGLFVAGSVPGGGNSNIFCILLNGYIAMSVTMTTVSIFASLGMLPLWIYTLGKYILENNTEYSDVSVPFARIVLSLALLIVPAAGGMLLRYKKEAFTQKLNRVYKLVFVVVVLLTTVYGLYINTYIFSYVTPRLACAALLLPYCGLLIGMGVAALFRQSWQKVFTIGIETSLQNPSLAYLVVKYCMDPPDSDMAIVAPVLVLLLQPLPLWIAVIVHRIWLRCFFRRGKCLQLNCIKEDANVQKTGAEANGKEGAYNMAYSEPEKEKIDSAFSKPQGGTFNQI